MECFTDDTKMGIELHSGEKLNMVSNLCVNGLKSKHGHSGAEHSKRICRTTRGITLSAVCSSSLRELISCFRYWISDSLTRSRTYGNKKPASLHLSRHSVTPAVPGDNQAKEWRLSPTPAPQSLWSTHLLLLTGKLLLDLLGTCPSLQR